MRCLLPFALVVLFPGLAWAEADALPDLKPHEVTRISLNREKARLAVDVLRQGLASLTEPEAEVQSRRVVNPEVDLIAGGLGGPKLTSSETTELARRDGPDGFLGRLLATDKELPGRGGVGPWQLLDGEFDESGCRSPVVADSAATVALVCRGLDRTHPRDEHLVRLTGRRIERHVDPVAPGAIPSISADGGRVAIVMAEGSQGSIHLVDFVQRLDVRLTGGWEQAQGPRLSARGTALAFVAVMNRKPVAIVIQDDAEDALLAWRGRKRVGVDGVADDGNRLLVRSDPAGALSSLFVDLAREVWTDIGDRKGDVQGAALHRSAEAAVFVSRVGGVCGLFWTALVTRRRTEIAGTAAGCFTAVDIDAQRRFVIYEQTESSKRTVLLYDRRNRLPWMTLPTGCAEAALSGDGYYVAARCSHDPRGRGIYLFAVPQENPAP